MEIDDSPEKLELAPPGEELVSDSREPDTEHAVAAADDNYDTRSEVSNASSKSMHSELSVDVEDDAARDGDGDPEGSEPSVSSVSADEREEDKLSEKADAAEADNDKHTESQQPENGSNIIRTVVTTGLTDKEAAAATASRESYLTKLNYLFRDTRFFIIKSNNEENISIAKNRSVWSTPPANEAKLNQAYRESRNVLLIFSVKESGQFCGFCRLSSESRRDLSPVNWILPPGLPARALGGVFKISWINKNDLAFTKTMHLYNPWNNGKPVKIGRDGQEVEPRVAEELCRRFTRDENIDMNPILLDSKRASRMVKSSKPLAMGAVPYPVARRGRRDMRGSDRGGGPDPRGYRSSMNRLHPRPVDYGREPTRLPSRYPPRPPRYEAGPYGRQAVPHREPPPRYHPYGRQRVPPPPPPPPSHHERSPPRYSTRDSVPRMYPELVREMTARGAPLPPLPYPPPAMFDPLAPPRYYDGPPLPDYVPPPPPPSSSRSERRGGSEYDRSVEEFLRHTTTERREHRERERDRDRDRERERERGRTREERRSSHHRERR